MRLLEGKRQQNALQLAYTVQIKIDGIFLAITAWKVSKYGVISGPYFPVFRLNTWIYGPEITPHLDTFHAVILFWWCGTNNMNNKKEINIFKVGKCQKKKT